MENRTFIKVIVTLLCIGCTLGCKNDVPSKYPNHKEMVNILVDLHMAEATLNAMIPNNISTDKKDQGCYKYILEKHHISKREFDSALAWYVSHPAVYQKVYDDVMAVLSEKEAFNTSLLSKENDKPKATVDEMKVVSLWKGDVSYKQPLADSIDMRIPIDIKTDSLKLGDIKLSASYLFKKEDQTTKNEVVIISLFADQKSDTLRYEVKKSNDKSSCSVSAPVDSGKVLIGIKGFLLDHDMQKKSSVDIENISMEFVPRSVVPDRRK
jgi:hypothetical protein